MSKLNRRTFIKLFGQGTAALAVGMGLSSRNAWAAQTEGAKTAAKPAAVVKNPNIKYQIFQPGEYLHWEKKIIEDWKTQYEKGPQKGSGGIGGGMSTLPEDGGTLAKRDVVKEEDIIEYNNTWMPENPLYNNKEYALKAGFPGIPARACFKSASGNSPTIPEDIADTWYYGNDGSDVYTFQHIFAGDSFTSETKSMTYKEHTAQGSDLRIFQFGSTAEMYNQKGELAGRSTGSLRNAYRKIIDGSPPPTKYEKEAEWVKYMPPPHYTTDEEWEYIKEIWNKEYIRGSQKLYWEDVNIGDEPAWTCSGPVSHATMIGWWGLNRVPVKQVLKANLKLTYQDPYGQYMFGTVRHCTGRNIPGGRASFFNNTASQFCINMLHNYIGDAGLVTRVRWYFKQVYRELWGGASVGEDLGEEHMNKVPYMKGRKCDIHGFETDTIIAKGYVTNKYKNDKGEGIIDVTAWCENLEGSIIQVDAMSAKLPLKKG